MYYLVQLDQKGFLLVEEEEEMVDKNSGRGNKVSYFFNDELYKGKFMYKAGKDTVGREFVLNNCCFFFQVAKITVAVSDADNSKIENS